MFGRTRRKEAERFTRSVVAMRNEAHSLEALLEVLSQRINDSRSELVMISQHLMQLGDQATGKLGGITREFDDSSERLVRHGEALDRAAEAARNDIAVLLDDLPRAETTARSLAEQIRALGSESSAKAAEFGQRVGQLAEQTQATDQLVADATQRLAARLNEIESAGTAAVSKVGEAEASFSGVLDALLERTSASLGEIRSAIDAQAAAVSALVEQASAGPRQGRRGSVRIAGVEHRPRQFVAGKPVGPGRRAGTRVAADDRRDRARPRADRRALHRARQPRRRARQSFPRIAHPRPDRARHARRAGRHPGQCDRRPRRADRRDAREHRAACRRNPRGCRHRYRRSARQCRPSRLGRADRQAGDRLDARRRRRGGRAPVGDRQPDRRPAGRAVGAAGQDRRRSRRFPGEAGEPHVGDCRSPGAGRQPQRRNRPGAGRRPGPGQGGCHPCRRACARSDRGGHPGKRWPSCPTRPGKRSSG